MAIGLGAAILGGAAISGVGSVLGAREASDGAKYAARLEARRMRELKPFTEAGKEALPQFQEGINDIPTMADLLGYVRTDPGIQFQMEQGRNLIEGGAAARGKLLSGDTLRELTEYGQGVASQGIDTALNRNLTLQGTRQNQLLSLLQAGLSASGRPSQLPSLALAQGQAKSDMYTNLSNTANNAVSNYTFLELMKKSPYFGGGANAGGAAGG